MKQFVKTKFFTDKEVIENCQCHDIILKRDVILKLPI